MARIAPEFPGSFLQAHKIGVAGRVTAVLAGMARNSDPAEKVRQDTALSIILWPELIKKKTARTPLDEHRPLL